MTWREYFATYREWYREDKVTVIGLSCAMGLVLLGGLISCIGAVLA